MANPPFSIDPLEDIPAGDADYVDKYDRNKERFKAEIIDLNSRMLAALGSSPSFDPFLENGQLEVNGQFALHRRMHEVARTVTVPVNGNVIVDPTYYNVMHTGVGLGIVGAGIYSYHPTVCPGWFCPLAMMPASVAPAANGFGDEPAGGGFGMQIDIPAAARLNGANDESVIFQPISVHTPPDRWAGRTVRVQLVYEHDAAVGLEPELYAAWDVGGMRTFAHGAFTDTNALLPATGIGTTNTKVFDFSPPAGATMFEIGVRVRDPGAHTFVFRKFIASTNLKRDVSLTYPVALPLEQALLERYYYRSVHGKDGIDFLPAATVLTAGAPAQKEVAMNLSNPVQDPAAAITLSRWSAGNAALYAKPLLVTQTAPISGVLIASVTENATVAMLEKAINQGGPGFADFDDWKGLRDLAVQLYLDAPVLGNDFNPDWLIEYDGEWLPTFKPLLLP